MIEVVDVVHHYGVLPVLKSVNLRFEKGELIVIVGPNGMGKSTLMAVLAGVILPVRGHVAIDGVRWRQSAQDELALRSRTTYLPDHAWIPGLRTGREFLHAVGRVYAIEPERILDHANRLLNLFSLTDHADSPIRSYSGGQQKKIALCGSLIAETPILFLDEPFSGGLDPAGLHALKRILQYRVQQQGATVILTSPVPQIVEEIASRIVILKDGQVAAFDTVGNLSAQAGEVGLENVLEKLLHAETEEKLADYFKGIRA
jgi:ABC-type multidrug transport system ATPase subunit